MSLYAWLYGADDLATQLLRMLGIDIGEIARFRDCFLDKGKICIRTRTGGDNRKVEEWAESNEMLRANEFYLSNHDCDSDETYAEFFFKFPPQHEAMLKKLEEEERIAELADAIEKCRTFSVKPAVQEATK